MYSYSDAWICSAGYNTEVLVLRVKARTQCNGGRGQELTNTNLFELFLLVLVF